MTRAQHRLRGLTLALAIAAARSAAAAPATPPPTLTADHAVEVIELATNSSGAGAIVLTNPTQAPITASAVAAEPGCDAAAVHAPLTGFTIAAGDSHSIPITCSAAPAGMQRCSYQVHAPSGDVLAEIEAVCAYANDPTLVPDTTAIDFGATAVGTVATHAIALHNTGTTPIDHLFIETTDPAGNFAVAAPCNPDGRECDAAVRTVAPNATTTLIATCTPRSVGAHTAELHIATSAGTRLGAPIALICTGSTAAGPALSILPGVIDVGDVELAPATSVTTTVHLGNAGPGSLRLSALQLFDGGTGAAADWTVTAGPPCSAAIPPACPLDATAPTTDLTIAFSPRAHGVRDATLLVNYRDTADRSISIPLRGTGSGPTLDAIGAPAILDFGTLPSGTSATLELQVTNHGTRMLGDGAISLVPAGPPFSVSPSSSLAVTTTAPTPVTVTCAPTATGPFTTKLSLSAPDVLGPPLAVVVRCAGDPAQTLFARPPAFLLGEVRTGTSVLSSVAVGPPGTVLSSAQIDPATAGLSVGPTPLPPPAPIDLTAAPQGDTALTTSVVVKAQAGAQLTIPVAGAAVTASYTMPSAVSLGTFCVLKPTTPRVLALSSTGSATIGLSAPVLQSADSPFDLTAIAPTTFPNILASHHDAIIAITPKRSATVGMVSDTVSWPTDVAAARTARTTLTATFIDIGGGVAVAPGAIDFGQVPIHVDTHNAKQVTLENCDPDTLRLDPPQVPSPFSIDSASFPASLNPGEIATFSVGFHPTQTSPDPITKKLVITSSQLHDPITVDLSGQGIATGPDGDAGTTSAGLSSTSFYSCGSCTTADPSTALALTLAALAALLPRRRRT
jgi:MYXO-CTERM domain-containing protein